MKTVVFPAFILLLLLGNCFGAYKLFTAKEDFLSKFPKLTEEAYGLIRYLPLVNIIALAGVLFWQKWGVYLAVACAILIIVCDILFGIYYHLFIAVPSTIFLIYLIARYWNFFE
ncbi:MAG TPA: hypothetical protein PLU37_10375 [Chitinophagaceae bacterium]|nr:hypothetical protein [Chitinophagaceae bacterium]MCB9054941.1 hypothetical protein [Chitinophagales bacterium]HPG11927.1 hypothetical protein [Chitinophagaceae bacterium]